MYSNTTLPNPIQQFYRSYTRHCNATSTKPDQSIKEAFGPYPFYDNPNIKINNHLYRDYDCPNYFNGIDPQV